MNMNSHAYAVVPSSQRQNQTAVIAPSGARLSSKTSEAHPTNAPTFARNAANSLQPASAKERGGTVASDARNGQSSDDTANGKKPACNDSVAPLNDRSYVAPPIIGKCEQCGAELTRKSRNGRLPKYCSSACRVAAWRERQRAGREETVS